MTDEELLESIKVSLQFGLAKIQKDSFYPQNIGLVLFSEPPKDILKNRKLAIKNNDPTWEWFLITNRPCGLEWKDDTLHYCGMWVIEVENLEIIRNELENIKVKDDK